MSEHEAGADIQAVKKRKRTGSEREARKKALIEVGSRCSTSCLSELTGCLG